MAPDRSRGAEDLSQYKLSKDEKRALIRRMVELKRESDKHFENLRRLERGLPRLP